MKDLLARCLVVMGFQKSEFKFIQDHSDDRFGIELSESCAKRFSISTDAIVSLNEEGSFRITHEGGTRADYKLGGIHVIYKIEKIEE